MVPGPSPSPDPCPGREEEEGEGERERESGSLMDSIVMSNWDKWFKFTPIGRDWQVDREGRERGRG